MKEISIFFTRHERSIESWNIGFYDLKFTHIAIYFSLMSHDIKWIHKGSSCILLRSSMSKVSFLKIHNDRKEILSSFVTKEKIIFNRRKKRYPLDQVKRQIKYQCWHIDKHTRPWGSIFIFPWGIYEVAVFLIPVSSASLVRMNYSTIIYDFAYYSIVCSRCNFLNPKTPISDITCNLFL